MAELLICARDKVNASSVYLDAKCYKRFDVIDVRADGWPWGREELSAPQRRILRVTNLTLSEAQAWLASEPEVDPLQPSRTLQRRLFRLNLDHVSIPAAFLAKVRDDSRAEPILVVGLTLPQLRALVVRKTPIPDPNVIGLSPNIF